LLAVSVCEGLLGSIKAIYYELRPKEILCGPVKRTKMRDRVGPTPKPVMVVGRIEIGSQKPPGMV